MLLNEEIAILDILIFKQPIIRYEKDSLLTEIQDELLQRNFSIEKQVIWAYLETKYNLPVSSIDESNMDTKFPDQEGRSFLDETESVDLEGFWIVILEKGSTKRSKKRKEISTKTEDVVLPSKGSSPEATPKRSRRKTGDSLVLQSTPLDTKRRRKPNP